MIPEQLSWVLLFGVAIIGIVRLVHHIHRPTKEEPDWGSE